MRLGAAGFWSPRTPNFNDDPVRDMMEVMTSFCARLYGRRSARRRAAAAVQAAAQDAPC
jgi:predicted site-specific integrase-resolvase